MTLFNSLVRSRLEYCYPLWSPYLQKDIIKIESVQRSFTARIACLKEMNYHDRLRYLGLYSLQRRRERYIIIQVWKIWKGSTQMTLSWSFNSMLELVLNVDARKQPGLHTWSLDTLKFNSFYSSSSGPALFNTIPGLERSNWTKKMLLVSIVSNDIKTHIWKESQGPPYPRPPATLPATENINYLLECGYSKKDLLGGGSACQSDLSWSQTILQELPLPEWVR